ncbi:MAG: type II toxin-antitoxin system RelE/ParE family toxin [Pseudomonadota bacterium]
MQLTISDQARRDIEDIYTYSYQKFGQQKARQYIRQIEQRIYQIRDNPKLSKNLNFIKQDLRCIIIFSHVIYYLAKPEELIILRVLHQNQDAIRHL